MLFDCEALIWLKCSYYTKKFTDLTQSLSRFHWHFSEKQNKKNPKMCIEPQNNLEKEQSWKHHAP